MTIRNIQDQQSIPTDEKYHNLTLKGDAENVSKDQTLWVFTKGTRDNKYHPFHSPIKISQDGEWTSSGTVGPTLSENKDGNEFSFFVYGVNKKVSKMLDDYIKNATNNDQYSGLLISDIEEHGKIELYVEKQVQFMQK